MTRDRGANDIEIADREFVWHPYTQAKTAPPPIEIVSGKGAVLTARDGRDYLDMISSWWVTIHGHGEPRIARAVAEQAARLEHVIFADVTHAPGAELARRLAGLLPGDLSRVYFSDNGSTSVEIALKIALQYWRNRGQGERRRLVAFEGGYHGDTFGAMSVGATSGFFEPFLDLLLDVSILPYPATYDGDPDIEETERRALAAAGDLFAARGKEIAAVVIEPLVQGAGGMRLCRPGFLAALAALARDAGALLIFDEVMTGFGRTGEMFACLKAGVTPDIVCLAKGLSGGFVPLAATVCTAAIYEAFLDADFAKAFAHGHTFTGNPIGCAAALASLNIFETDGTLAQIAGLADIHRERLTALARHPRASRPRHIGAIGAFDVAGREKGYTSDVGPKLKQYFRDRGFLIRPLGNVVYLMPPYCIAPADLHRAYDAIEDGLKAL